MKNYTDIIIIGAGLSGIGSACHLERKNPEKSYIIIEAREELGGTWSLFKYPGIRSDSDMYTFGFSFKTWDNPKSFADAPNILKYLDEAANEYNIKDKIRYQTKVVKANFDTQKKMWSIFGGLAIISFIVSPMGQKIIKPVLTQPAVSSIIVEK